MDSDNDKSKRRKLGDIDTAGEGQQQPQPQSLAEDSISSTTMKTSSNSNSNKTSLSESLAQSTAACLFHTTASPEHQHRQSLPQQQQQQQQEVAENKNTATLTNDVGKKSTAVNVNISGEQQTTTTTINTNTNTMKRLKVLKVSSSMLSLPLSSPLHTPREDEGVAVADINNSNNNSNPNDNDETNETSMTKNNTTIKVTVGGAVVADDSRKRRMSIEEDILLGSGSRNSSMNSLILNTSASGEASGGVTVNGSGSIMPVAKKLKVESIGGEKEGVGEETKKEEEDCFAKYHTPATWSARQNLGIKDTTTTSSSTTTTTTTNSTTIHTSASATNTSQQQQHPRWRSHQMAQDYISLASAITLPPNNTHLGSFGYTPSTGHYPIEQVTALGYLTSPLRRPTVIEKWNPYEISTFEAALAIHGKVFHQVSKWVKTKNTKEVIEFYYIWKKTSHGKRWKGVFVAEMESESEEEGVRRRKVEGRMVMVVGMALLVGGKEIDNREGQCLD